MAKALTTASVGRLKPNPARRIEVPDGLLPGLYLIIQPSGARSWAVRYRSGGRTRKLTLGGYPALELGDARNAARAALEAASKGADPAGQKKKRRELAPQRTFIGVARSYLERDAIENRSRLETARLLGLRPSIDDPTEFVPIPKGIAGAWSHRDIGEIAREDVLGEIDTIMDRGSGIAANRTLAALRRMFNWSVERGLIASAPTAGVTPPAQEVTRDRVLTDDETKWLWAAASEIGYPFGTIVKLLMVTGQRRSEVAGMSRREFALDRWVIPSTRAKNGQLHEVPLTKLATRVLDEVPPELDDLLFTTTGTIPVSGWSRAKARMDAAMLTVAREERRDLNLEIAPWTFHDERRTVASGMARLGVAVHVVEKQLNHRTGTIRGVAAIYNRHEYWPERVAAAEVWASYLQKLIGDV